MTRSFSEDLSAHYDERTPESCIGYARALIPTAIGFDASSRALSSAIRCVTVN